MSNALIGTFYKSQVEAIYNKKWNEEIIRCGNGFLAVNKKTFRKIYGSENKMAGEKAE
jgi:hypothetical protein